MRVQCLGAYFMKGTANKSGQPYDMAKVVIRTPIETVVSQKMQKGGYGYSTNELDLEPGALKHFNMAFPPEGIELDLEVGAEVRYGRLQSIVIGCKRVPAVKAA